MKKKNISLVYSYFRQLHRLYTETMRESGLFTICGLFSSILLLHSEAHGSPVTCSSPGVECEYNNDNYIDTEYHVHSEEECRAICEDQDQCQFITYFNASASPFSNICQSFKTCDSVVKCENCVSQNMDCFRTCGSNIVGQMDENIIDGVFGVQSELKCKELCSKTDECSWYTFFFSNSTNIHDFCALLTELLPPIETSNTAISGPGDCSQESCTLLTNGERHQTLMINDTEAEVSIDVTALGPGSCQLTLLAVGGGGEGSNGGGGSGYLKYRKVALDPGVNTIRARVGAGSQASTVIINGVTNITAMSGQPGGLRFGGDGYSGGGGFLCNCDGGSDGGRAAYFAVELND